MKKLAVLLVVCMLLGGCGTKEAGVATDDQHDHEGEVDEVLASYTTDDYIEFSHEDKCIRMYMVENTSDFPISVDFSGTLVSDDGFTPITENHGIIPALDPGESAPLVTWVEIPEEYIGQPLSMNFGYSGQKTDAVSLTQSMESTVEVVDGKAFVKVVNHSDEKEFKLNIFVIGKIGSDVVDVMWDTELDADILTGATSEYSYDLPDGIDGCEVFVTAWRETISTE